MAIPFMTIDRGLEHTSTGARAFLRLDYHAGGLEVWAASVKKAASNPIRRSSEKIRRGLQVLQCQVRQVCFDVKYGPPQALTVKPRAFDDRFRICSEKARAERVGRFRPNPQRRKRDVREMCKIVGDDGPCLSRDGCCDHVSVTRVRQRDCFQGARVRPEIRARKGALHLRSSVFEARRRVAELGSAVPHPFVVDRIRPCGAERAGFGDP